MPIFLYAFETLCALAVFSFVWATCFPGKIHTEPEKTEGESLTLSDIIPMIGEQGTQPDKGRRPKRKELIHFLKHIENDPN